MMRTRVQIQIAVAYITGTAALVACGGCLAYENYSAAVWAAATFAWCFQFTILADAGPC